VSFYGLFADPSDVTVLVDRIPSSVPTAATDLLRSQLESITESASSSLGVGVGVGIAAALWSASSGFGHLIEGLNIAYDEEESRGFFERRALALGFTLLFLTLVAAVVGVITVATGVVSDGVAIAALIVGWLIVAVLFALFLAVLYRYAPNRDEPQWAWVSPGSLVAVVGWTIMTVGFGFYVSRFGSYNETYGSLGAIVVTLTWMYLTAVIALLGAEINTELERQTRVDSTDGEPQPMGRRDADAADELGVTSIGS